MGLGDPLKVNVTAVSPGLDDLARSGTTFLAGEIVEAKKKTQNSQSENANVHEESLGIETLVELDNLDGLIEHGVDEEVACGVPVVEVDSESDGATSEGVSWDK